MRLIGRGIAAVLFSAWASCASASGLLSYGAGVAEAKFSTLSGGFAVYVHPKEDKLLLQRTSFTAETLTSRDIAPWRNAAEVFVQPIGCGISRVEALSVKGQTWEAWYICPDGVDLRALAAAQRQDLRRGRPIHP